MEDGVSIGGRFGGGDQDLFDDVCLRMENFIHEHRSVGGRMNVVKMLTRHDILDDLLLTMAKCQNLDEIYKLVCSTFGNMVGTALVRIWIVGPANGNCISCAFKDDCRDKTTCLHLVASDGYSIVQETEWNNIEGRHAHLPFRKHKVGVIAATCTPFFANNITRHMPWVSNPDWIETEKIQTCIGQPLINGNELIGVLMIFSRENLDKKSLDGLRIVADHLVVKIVNARSFEEVKRLKRQLEIENTYLQRSNTDNDFNSIIGESVAIQKIKEQISQVAPTDALVLITGESGTGKELVANELHAKSAVANGPLIKVNCPTVPQELFESEFFGHTRGAFTGANSNHIGFFEAAEGGSLFLDEIAELGLSQQSKLLRALQEHEYRRVGEENIRKFHTRVIAATNRDLKEMVGKGTLREDLFYRLNVFPINMPPLRERRDDIPLFIYFFLRKFSEHLNRPDLKLNPDQLDILMRYSWPGNIRELKNIIHRAAILATDTFINLDFFEYTIHESIAKSKEVVINNEPNVGSPPNVEYEGEILDSLAMKEFEKQNMLRALKKCNGKIFGKRGAAELLKIQPTTLIARIEKMGIDRKNLV